MAKLVPKKPADYGDLSKYWQGGPKPAHEVYTVVVDYVKVRSMPSTDSAVKGTVKKDELVRGEVRHDYLLLSTELSSEKLMAGEGRWLLIDGASVPSLGVGVLLKRAVGKGQEKTASKAEAKAKPKDKKKEVTKRALQPEDFGDLSRYLDAPSKKPLLESYKVAVEYVMIRSMPSIKSVPQGRLKCGQVIRGEVRGDFLLLNPELSKERLLNREGSWVLIDGSSEPSLKVGILLQRVTSTAELSAAREADDNAARQSPPGKSAEEARRREEEEARVRIQEEAKQAEIRKRMQFQEEAARAEEARRKKLEEEVRKRSLEEAERKRQAEEALKKRLEERRQGPKEEDDGPKEELNLKAAAEKAGTDVARFVISMVSKAKNHYDTLGVRPSATRKEIRKAYRYISLKIHPDKVQGTAEDEELKSAAESTFKLVAAAYEVLEDHGKRAAYDARRRGVRLPPAPSQASRSTPQPAQPPARAEPEFREPVKVAIRVKHAIHDDEVLLAINHGQTAYFLKQALATKVKRGPWYRLEFATNSGANIPESYAFTRDDTIYAIGLRLGPPQEVRLKLVHASTRLTSHVLVRDTSTIAEVRTKIVEELHFERKRVLLGEHGKKERSFVKFPDAELLNGRLELLINGVDNVVQLTLQEGLQLQDELLEVYADVQFQERLTTLLEKHGSDAVECLADMSFREGFAKLVREAQANVLTKWGFVGERATHNMLMAFQGIGHEPAVQEKSNEIDKCLKVTYGGGLPPPRKPKRDKRGGTAKEAEDVLQDSGRKEEAKDEPPPVPVTITVRQAYTDDAATPSNVLEVVVPSNATFKLVRQTIAAALGGEGKACKPRVVRGLGKRADSAANTYVGYPDTATIKDKREFLIMGATIPASVPAFLPAAMANDPASQAQAQAAQTASSEPTAATDATVDEEDKSYRHQAAEVAAEGEPLLTATREELGWQHAAADVEEDCAHLASKTMPASMRNVLVTSVDGKLVLPLAIAVGSLMADLKAELMSGYSSCMSACELRLVRPWSTTLFLPCRDEEPLPEAALVYVMGLDFCKALAQSSTFSEAVDSSEFEPEAEPT